MTINMHNNMQIHSRILQEICKQYAQYDKKICRICKKYVKKYANPFGVCRIATGLYSAYLSCICTPHFADVRSSEPP